MRDARGNELSVAALINEPGGGNKSCDYCVRKRRRDRPESSINDVQLGPIVGNFSFLFFCFLPFSHSALAYYGDGAIGVRFLFLFVG